MSKKREYKTTWVGDYKIAIDICDKDVPCVMVGKYLTNDVVKNVFGYYSKDVVDFFLTVINKLKEKDQRIAELEEQLKNSRVKYCIGFDSDFNVAVKELDLNIILPNWMHDKEFKFYDTKEEAQAKLKELKGENK